MRIAILAGQLETWGGGVDLLRYLLRGLLHRDEHEFTLVLAARPPGWLPRLVVKNTRSLLRPWMRRFPRGHEEPFRDLGRPLTILATAERDRALDALEADLVLPVADAGVIHPFVGYIYDCQHRHLPHLFKPAEIEARDRLFQHLASRGRALMVNSRDTLADATRYYGPLPGPGIALPFAPQLDPTWLEAREDLSGPLKLPPRYFAICNQVWKHKAHETAIQALAMLDRPEERDLCLICTGCTEDYRFPEHGRFLQGLISELGLDARVRFTGHLAKRAQVEVLRNSLAVVQPTRCEGGPGGGSVYDAHALGHRAIVSDIAVNLELPDDPAIRHFPVDDAEALAARMREVLAEPWTRPADELLLRRRSESLESLSAALHHVIEVATRPSTA